MTALADIKPVEQVLPASPRGLPLPWWAKIAAKIVLSRIFRSYRTRRALGLFLHGNLDQNVDQHEAFVANVLAQPTTNPGEILRGLVAQVTGGTVRCPTTSGSLEAKPKISSSKLSSLE